jgi:Zn-dependent alcohol dehydrogenase
MMVTRLRAIGPCLSVLLLLSACGSSVKEVESTDHRRRHFRVECVREDQCKKRATAACGPNYEVISEWHNTIPESDLPGLNESSRVKDARDFNDFTLQSRTGIESNEPMPLSSYIVACNG